MSHISFPALALALTLLASLAPAQDTRSMIFGRVTDPQSSAVAAARVALINVDTNTALTLSTNDTGYYEANLLLPGNYRVEVESAGFKKTIRSGITLSVSSRIEVSLRLELGAVVESVSVTADAPLIDTNSVATGRVIDNRSVMELPVLSNSPLFLARMAPGVQTGGVNIRWGLHSNSVGGGYDIGVAGNVGGNEYSIDGVPNMTLDRRPAQLPYADTILEFKVETSNFDASVGHTSNVAVTMMSRAGTNQLHGAATYQHWQQRWQGAGFFVKQLYYRGIATAEAKGDAAAAARLRAENITPSGRYNNIALSTGGPVFIPKIYNGKDKLFFYFSAVGVRSKRSESGSGGSIVNTVPTLAQRQGDFSDLLRVDAGRYQIYDPLSVRPDPARPSHFIRDPIPGNILPANRIANPAAKVYSGFLPTANTNPLSASLEPTQNYLAVGQPNMYSYYSLNQRTDYQHSSRHRFFGKWSWNTWDADTGDWTYETARGLMSNMQHRDGIGATLDWVYTHNSSTMLDVAIAGNTFADGTVASVRETYTAASVGLPAYLDAQVGDRHTLPTVSLGGYSGFGRGYPSMTRAGTMSARADLTHIRGAHTIRTGFDARQQYRTGGGGGSPSGSFGFDNTYTRRNDDSFTPAGSLGHSYAAFLMGVPTSMGQSQPDSYALYNPYYGWYVQESWRATRKLTLNVGLRMEYELGGTERYNRAMGAFDTTLKLPISDAAEAAYARNPISERTTPFTVRGGSLYVGAGGASRGFVQNQFMLLPRAALGYQLDSKTVVRAGYGIFYDTINVMNRGVSQTGYGSSTSTILSTDFGQTWLAGNPKQGVSPLTDPFPVRADGARFNQPLGNVLGSMAVAGSSFTFWDYDTKHARQQRWRAGVQRQIGSSNVIEFAYSGSYSDNTYIDRNLNPLAAEYWATGMTRNDAVATNMNANVTNPFALSNFSSLASNSVLYSELGKRSFFTSSTTRKNQLLRPYPQLTGLVQTTSPLGRHRTDDLQVSFERRFSKGFNLNAAYTRLRSRAKGVFLNEFDPEPTWVESNNGRPHRFTATSVVVLPFGKGQRLATRGLPALVLGGFQVSATYEWQPGPLITFGNLFYYGQLDAIRTDNQTLDHWFNTDNFERTAAKGPAAYHVRVFPDRIEGLRSDMTNNWNVNIQREFKMERASLQFRVDCMNLQNRSQFEGPGTSPYSTDFGRVTTQTAAMNRFIQAQLRIRF